MGLRCQGGCAHPDFAWVIKRAKEMHSRCPPVPGYLASEAARLFHQLPGYQQLTELRRGQAAPPAREWELGAPSPSARYLLWASAAPVQPACFRWAGPASPNVRPGVWRTWTQCSASSCTGQCWPGLGSDRPAFRVPGKEGQRFPGSRGSLFGMLPVRGSRGSDGGIHAHVFRNSMLRTRGGLAAGTLVPRGPAYPPPHPRQKTPLSKEAKKWFSTTVL